jgi:hypothetical protein
VCRLWFCGFSFSGFQERFRKRYPSEREDNFRKQLFLKKLRHVEEHNEKYDRGLAPFKIGLHQFSDYTDDEKKTILLDWK